MDKRIIAIGGGEIREKSTLKIDEYIANLAKIHAGENRATGLFIGTASHDSMPYFNSFRKTYTSVFDIKADCALVVYGEMDYEKIKSKFEKADFIYVGGGDTVYMLEKWKESGITDLILKAYDEGKIICGLSAGAICWFEKMYSDHNVMVGNGDYDVYDGLGVLDGIMTPHYNERAEDFDKKFLTLGYDKGLGVENDCAVEFVNGQLTKSISAGGKAYLLTKFNGEIVKTEISGE